MSMDCTVCSTVVATEAAAKGRPILGRDAKEPVATHFFIILLNVEDVIGPLPCRIAFMKRYPCNAEMALSEFL